MATTTNTFNVSNPQSPVPAANPVECDARGPSNNGSLASFGTATTGMTEYTASDFAGQMNGNLLLADYYGNLIRIRLNAAGTGVVSTQKLFSNIGTHPLAVATQGDRDAFPGTIWVPDFAGMSGVGAGLRRQRLRRTGATAVQRRLQLDAR